MMFKGGQIQSKQKFLYGKFDCLTTRTNLIGTVSSFFLFSDAEGWQQDWKEIDFEWVGKQIGKVQTNIITTVDGQKAMREAQHICNDTCTVSIEWTHDKIVFKINGVVVRTSLVQITKPMKLMMNLSTPSSTSWAGTLDLTKLPVTAVYNHVSYFPLSLRDGGFRFLWKDSFSTLDLNRWQIGTWSMDRTQWVRENVSVENGKLKLKLSM